MLNTFPSLLSYGLVAPFILRIVLGALLISIGLVMAFRRRDAFVAYFTEHSFPFPLASVWIFGIAEIVTGAFLVMGLSTQTASIVAIFLLTNIYVFEKRDDRLLPHSPSLYLALAAIALSLLFTGAGFFALDLPL